MRGKDVTWYHGEKQKQNPVDWQSDFWDKNRDILVKA